MPDEPRAREIWESAGLFTAPKIGATDDVECLILPAPSPNGRLHIGHALNLSLQDMYARHRRMSGKKVVWLALIDHGGLATQIALEDQLSLDGVRRQDLSSEEFRERIRKFNDQNCAEIYQQMMRYGASMDYAEMRFLGDEERSRHIAELFVDMYEKGLIYRAQEMVNWCPRCSSALSDLEVEVQTAEQMVFEVAYSLAEDPDQSVSLMTTAPETLLGDVAVAVNLDDQRAASLLGCTVHHPITHERLPVVPRRGAQASDEDPVTRVAPALGPIDFDLASTLGLPVRPVFAANGAIIWLDGEFLARTEARQRAIELLDRDSRLVSSSLRASSVPVCARCKSELHASISDQWFLRRDPLVSHGRSVLKDGELTLIPSFYQKDSWWEGAYVSVARGLSGTQDWCISRQIAWGNPIPAWVCEPCGQEVVSLDALRSGEVLPPCPQCGSPMERETDVLDMAFSCSLYAVVAMRCLTEDEQILRKLHQNCLAVTGADLVYSWIPMAAMVGKALRSYVPFHTAVLHGLVTDRRGQKMSKSLGNVISVDDAVGTFGADVVRYALLRAFDIDEVIVGLDWDLLADRAEEVDKLCEVFDHLGESLVEERRHLRSDSAAASDDGYERISAVAGQTADAIVTFQPSVAIDLLRRFTLEEMTPFLGSRQTENRRTAYADLLALWHPFIPHATEMMFDRYCRSERPLAQTEWPA